MNTMDSTMSSKESSSFKRVKSKNESLVRTLQHKMFRGFRAIKQAQNYYLDKPKYIDKSFWEDIILYPFDDYYNLQYKRRNLSSIYKEDLSDMIQINNYSKKRQFKNNKNNQKFENSRKFNNFRKKPNVNTFFKKITNKDKYFYFNSNSLLIKNDLDKNNIEKRDILFKTIFSDENEKGLYNDIPIFAIEKLLKINDNKKKEFIYLPSKEERKNDLQFLYKLSHKLPSKKLDFRIKYNIKSAKQRKKNCNNIMKSAVLTSLSYKIQSAKPNKNRLNLKRNNSDIFMTTVKKNNNDNNDNNVNLDNNNDNNVNLDNNNDNKNIKINKKIETEDLDIKIFHNAIIKRAQSSSGYKSRNKKLIRNISSGGININRDLRYKNIKNEIKVEPNYFPSSNRVISNQTFKNYINFKKSKFEKLKNVIEN